MHPKLRKKIILDANAIIDLHHYSIWEPIIHACRIAVTPIINREVRFYKDLQGQKQHINLSMHIHTQQIDEIPVSIGEFSHLEKELSIFFLKGIDEGEREAIAFLHSSKKKDDFLFCTADMLAIKCLGILGLRNHGLSMEELLEISCIHTQIPLPKSRSKQLFKKMLAEGFQEMHLHKK